jgi:hypothetical protein
MKRNRFKKLIAEIEVDESRYDQSSYTTGLAYDAYYGEPKVKLTKDTVINCNTTGCIAGLASFRWAPVGTKFWHNQIELPDGSWGKYHKFGRKMLGLTKAEADYLFAGNRSWGEIIEFSDMNKNQRNELLGV